jgi:uncharacterized protein (TIGR03437 family)
VSRIQIAAVAPGLFTANANGQGVPAALALRVKADGTQSYESIVQFDQTQNRFVPLAIDLGPASEQVFLILFGTGWRLRSALETVTCNIGEVSAQVFYAGTQGGLAGLDQANVALPRSLTGRGEVDLKMMVEGKNTNPVRVSVK